MISLASCSRFALFCTKGGDRAASCWNVSMAEDRRLIWTAGIGWISPRTHPASDASGNADRGIAQKNCFSSIVPPMRHVMSADVSRHALSRYALHQGTFSPRGPCLARWRFIHLVNTPLYAQRLRPSGRGSGQSASFNLYRPRYCTRVANTPPGSRCWSPL